MIEVFTRLIEGYKLIENGIRAETGFQNAFMTHEILGAVTCCPSNIGSGLRGSVHIRVPKLIARVGFDQIDRMCADLNC